MNYVKDNVIYVKDNVIYVYMWDTIMNSPNWLYAIMID